MKDGLTFDTGALISLERRSLRARQIVERALETKVRITVPSAVVVEWWRGRTDLRERILAAVRIEPLSREIAQAAGEALAAVRGATSVDAIVMASASNRGDVVYTSDVADLMRLQRHWPAVRVLQI